jgi:steroid delta-isomerase-like uncharacterized protein
VTGDIEMNIQNLNKTVVRRLIEEFLATGDPDVADEILAPHYVDHTPSNSGMTGPENLQRFVGEWLSAFPDTRNVVQDMVAEGDRVAARWTVSATHENRFRSIPTSGNRVEVEAIGIFRLANGKVVESWDKYDTPSLWQ